MNIIEIKDLCHSYPDGTRALEGINLSFSKGEFTIITGANGSGKTTLLKHFNALLTPDSGSIQVCGISAGKNPMLARKNIGMVFQNPDSQIMGETVYDDVAFGPENLRLTRIEIDKRVKQALKDMGLSGLEDKSPYSLSGGQKRCLAIAGVIAMQPKVLVMDEPFSNLDFRSSCKVLEQILCLHKNGTTIIITTHDLEKIIYHAKRLLIMDKGRVVKDGTPESVLDSLEHYGVRLPCSLRFNQGLQPWEM
ncbi:MAG: ABC transporter ATP-binding protein [Desulfobacterales bacterium]|nr:MAG: ABC transporter ATP-binding protein [Desulfobacterales bacterium]